MDMSNVIIFEVFAVGMFLGLSVMFLFYYFLFNSREF